MINPFGSWRISPLALLVPLLLGISTLGCGGSDLEFVEVTGTVVHDGAPVTHGIIFFVPQNGPQASAVLDENGYYELTTPGHSDGVVLGKHQVYIGPVYDPAPEFTAEQEARGEVPPPRTTQLKLPAKYQKPTTSGLTADVSAETETIHFELE